MTESRDKPHILKDGKTTEGLLLGKTARATGLHAILVNPRQRENPVIKHIRNVPLVLGFSLFC